jgi:hypothetical protein
MNDEENTVWFNRYERSWKKIHPEYDRYNDKPSLIIQFDNNKEKIIQDLKIIEEERKNASREKQRIKQNTPEHKKNMKEYCHQRWIDQKQEISKKRSKRLKTDALYATKEVIRTRIYLSLRLQGVDRTLEYEELLGCTFEELLPYIESKFLEGMTWENRGFNGWAFDHIIPCASFDLHDIEQQKKCFHYTNLQPLWIRDNSSKQARFRVILPKPSNDLAVALYEIEKLKKQNTLLMDTINVLTAVV